MKTYKTWEVIKMLSENNDLGFKTNIGNVSLKEIDDCKEMVWEEGTPFEINYYTLCYGWELIQEPVSFTDAVKAYNKGKTIKCNFDDDVLYYVPSDDFEFNSLEDNNGLCISSQEILNGAWFVESED
ncbi:hypothetical protein KPL28_02865 [Clostridium algidicarnis]|uniref:hypothetical protein n=1 Tax=Clostridium algidicarnis TaxID=37659 RepID=UPI001C0C9317|nr:hypothetical protein [Clostridium algidicarnis]MBU3208576.1 hypothetical protein [Clostridium algidicarnis]